MCSNSPKSVGRGMDQIHGDYNSFKRNNWKAVPPGSKRSPLYSCNFIDIEVSLINFFFSELNGTGSGQLVLAMLQSLIPAASDRPFQRVLALVLSNSPKVLIWGFHSACDGSWFSFLSKCIYFTFSGLGHPGSAHHLGYREHSELGFL